MCETEDKESREREMRRRLKRVLTEEYLTRADFLKRRIEEIDKDRVPFAYDDCCNVKGCLSRWDELTDAEVDRMAWLADDASLRMSEALSRLQKQPHNLCFSCDHDERCHASNFCDGCECKGFFSSVKDKQIQQEHDKFR